MSASVEYLDAEPSGLGAMLGGLIEANLASHPGRAALLRRGGTVGLVATDAAVAVTINLAPGRVTVADGIVGRPRLVVRADSETLAGLSACPLRLGLPDPGTAEGRATLAGLVRGRLRVRGMLASAGLLSRFNRLLSAA